MFTIGINSNHADSSIAVFEKNKLIFAIEEERINRIKHWSGSPLRSIQYALDYCNIEAEKITNVTFNNNPFSNITKKIPYFILNFFFSKKGKEVLERQQLKFKIKNDICNITNNKKIKFNYIDHHLSHISSAFFPSNFKNAVGLSIDGFGDFCSIAIAYTRSCIHSISLFYSCCICILCYWYSQLN